MRVLLAAVVLVAVGWLGWRFLAQKPAVVVPTDVAARVEAPAPEVAVPVPAETNALEPSRTETTPAPAPLPAKDGSSFLQRLFGGKSEPKAKPKSIAMEGIVIVVDRAGVEHSTESGTLLPWFVKEGTRANGDESWTAEWGEEVEVREGRFRVELPEGTKLGVSSMTLGDRVCVPDARSFDTIPGQPITVRVHWIENVRLHVLDAESRVELADVTVVRADEWRHQDCKHPGSVNPSNRVAEHATSPLELRPRPDRHDMESHEEFWVGAAGHAWSRHTVAFGSSVESEVLLGPAASLVVSIEGELPRAPGPSLLGSLLQESLGRRRNDSDEDERIPQLRLRTPVGEAQDFDKMKEEALSRYDEAPASDFPTGVKPSFEEFERMLEDMREMIESHLGLGGLVMEQRAALGEVRVDGLEPGELAVSVEVGRHWDQPLVVGSGLATLRANETTRMRLFVGALPPEPAKAAFSGTLFVPSTWDASELTLGFQPMDLRGKTSADEVQLEVDEMRPIPERRGWYRWDAGLLRPANYGVMITNTGFSTMVEVEAPGRNDFEIILPEAGTLVVRAVDDATGGAIAPENWGLRWRPLREDPAFWTMMMMIPLESDAAAGVWRARLPVGRGVLEYHDDELELAAEGTIEEIHGGDQEVTIRLRRACGVRLSLVFEGRPHPWPGGFPGIDVEAVGHDGDERSSSFGSDGVQFQFTKPGRYRVTMPAIPSFAPIEPFEVDVPAGSILEHTIELERPR